MENKLTKKDYENILNMLKMKQNFLLSCAKDYEAQIGQVEAIIKSMEPTVEVKEKESAESKKS